MSATTEKFAKASIPSVNADIQLKDIIKTLPRECFQKDRRKAWSFLFINVLAVSLGYVGIATLPWFLLPLAWIFTGTALTGFFVLAHDCGHRSFAKRRWVNDWVGHIMTLPLIYPFHCWRILHDRHHLHTNKLLIDNAWDPWTLEDYTQTNPFVRGFYQALRGRFWWLGSIAHWAVLHFDLSQFSERDRAKVKVSIASVVIFAAVFFPTLIAMTGIWGFVKFWLLPWLVYHFWMSTFTLVHHTAPNIQFRPAETWSAAEAQLAGTVHCTYPRWVEFLCHDINVHVPHHICVAIPSYNLRMAHESLKQNWGSHIQESKFSWALMKEIGDRCHLYHPEKAYQSFKDIQR
ncbi:fatty acid desaturase [Pleurocapsa sp. PCC 7327]|uniref:fatty acid desaturase n=1 Tax=Pleurocapsa sp. PCC 7327 TaxID=118163 RepID=UPI00029FE85D|nr:fatty acid desaturase [Pleurocapsa sp. PCC 7327]AFY78361.1 fatty acid desaturase [Pleurocapsa sp. PCC 7327]